MDRIPTTLRDSLTANGFVDRNDLPNVRDPMLWRDIREVCGFSIPELNNVINALFPVEGKSYYNFARFSLYFLQALLEVT